MSYEPITLYRMTTEEDAGGAAYTFHQPVGTFEERAWCATHDRQLEADDHWQLEAVDGQCEWGYYEDKPGSCVPEPEPRLVQGRRE